MRAIRQDIPIIESLAGSALPLPAAIEHPETGLLLAPEDVASAELLVADLVAGSDQARALPIAQAIHAAQPWAEDERGYNSTAILLASECPAPATRYAIALKITTSDGYSLRQSWLLKTIDETYAAL